ncbi:MAG: carboxypeptidase regulatory-like domain-containing protein [Acidobacteria bacterium]|nr:MAG: carboxypeptidase regulatory-like domain-containing protein [Acidobacteriota bacterium]
MLNTRQLTLLLVTLLALTPSLIAADDLGEPLTGLLAGRVTSSSTPLPSSQVYAYQLADLSLRKVVTDTEGNFLFDRLPAGLYKIIAYKSGFVPGIALLTRATDQARQYLDLELLEQKAAEARTGGGFWSVREQIPADVLRDIAMLEAGAEQQSQPAKAFQFQTEMNAVAGMDQVPAFGNAQVTGGRVGVRGRMRDLTIGVTGNFVQLQSSLGTQIEGELPSGKTQAVSVNVDNPITGGVEVSSVNNSMVTYPRQGNESVVDFQRHRVTWSQPLGEKGRSDFSAQYTDEHNFYSRGLIEPIGVPQASRSLDLSGSYSTAPTEKSTMRAGFRYRERTGRYEHAARLPEEMLLPSERVDVFGSAGLQVKPQVLVEFGLFSTMRDGSLSLAPSGGLVLQLAPNWRAFTSASVKAHEQEVSFQRQDFTPVFFGESNACNQADEYCYQVLLAHSGNDEAENLSFGAIHRQFADTLRLYFSEDFFNHLESLYLVRGDSLPELQFAITRRLGPAVLTRISSNVASGGGGVLRTVDKKAYENQVRFLVTSIDTQFQQTSTGVFIAFHHLAQELQPTGRRAGRRSTDQLEIDRLQLMLTQDLGILESIASDLAVLLNMEVSRGSTPDGSPYADEELRKRVMGGLAVKF